MDLRSAIKDRAIEVGFDLVGISPATPGRDLDFAREWLERGYGGEMRYLANPKRFDSRSVLPSLKSVICVGLIYDSAYPYSVEAGSWQKAEGRTQESEDGRQKSEARSRKTEGSEQHSEFRIQNPERPTSREPLPSPPARGWPRWTSSGTGEGTDRRFSSFDIRVSNFQFPVSTASERARAWISRYAWGRDYHEVMREKLERLRAAIEELSPGVETRVFVDTGPVVERAFARFSGVGWMGKNTCIINEEKGSWFFLGVVFTDLALEPDLPASDRCGSCRACLDACPTGALVEPYVMDARRCISYLTIELKGSIPLELRAGVGVNIFGCDICQDVCPWNGKSRFQVSGARCQEEGFQPIILNRPPLERDEVQSTNDERPPSERASGAHASLIRDPKSQIQNPPGTLHPEPSTFSLFAPPLEALTAMTEDDFRQAFRHSPVKRAKYRGWLRNLSVAMGNSGDARLVPRLQELAQHPDALVREHAEWALDHIARAS